MYSEGLLHGYKTHWFVFWGREYKPSHKENNSDIGKSSLSLEPG